MRWIKEKLKDYCPPVLLRFARAYINPLKKNVYFKGEYSTWEEAAALCSGYDAEAILDKVREATLKVKRGEAVFERDSVIFDKIQYSWPVAASLMWVAARNNGNLNVLDFGGSLGSSYFQNQKFILGLESVNWTVVEQRNFVEVGREQIADGVLTFSADINECFLKLTPNLVLLSSVLQYLPDPFVVLENIANRQVELIVIDRTPFSNDSISKIKIQHVSPRIYSASYPCWFFSRDVLVRKMNALNYELFDFFDALDDLADSAKWQGLIFIRRKKS